MLVELRSKGKNALKKFITTCESSCGHTCLMAEVLHVYHILALTIRPFRATHPSPPTPETVDIIHFFSEPIFAAYKDISGDEGQPNPQRPRFGAGSIFPPVHWCNPSRVSRWHRRAHGAGYQKSTYEANWLRCRSRNSRVLVTGEGTQNPKRDSCQAYPRLYPTSMLKNVKDVSKNWTLTTISSWD